MKKENCFCQNAEIDCIYKRGINEKIFNFLYVIENEKMLGILPGVLFPTHKMIHNVHFHHFNKLIFEIVEEIVETNKGYTKQSIIDEVLKQVISNWNTEQHNDIRDLLPIVRPSVLNRYINYLNEHDVVEEFKMYKKFCNIDN